MCYADPHVLEKLKTGSLSVFDKEGHFQIYGVFDLYDNKEDIRGPFRLFGCMFTPESLKAIMRIMYEYHRLYL